MAASPQLENGYGPLANELWDAKARTNFTAYEGRVFAVVVRQTYGWSRKSWGISLSFFSEATGIDRSNVRRTLQRLERRRIILANRDKFRTQYGVQKDWTQWLDGMSLTGVQPHPSSVRGLPTPPSGSNRTPKVGSNRTPKENNKAINLKRYITLPFLEFQDVHLTQDEYDKLITRFGQKQTHDLIERLSNYMGSKGKRYKSHYRTILIWAARDAKDSKSAVKGWAEGQW